MHRRDRVAGLNHGGHRRQVIAVMGDEWLAGGAIAQPVAKGIGIHRQRLPLVLQRQNEGQLEKKAGAAAA
jgi:hypothetical protein